MRLRDIPPDAPVAVLQNGRLRLGTLAGDPVAAVTEPADVDAADLDGELAGRGWRREAPWRITEDGAVCALIAEGVRR